MERVHNCSVAPQHPSERAPARRPLPDFFSTILRLGTIPRTLVTYKALQRREQREGDHGHDRASQWRASHFLFK